MAKIPRAVLLLIPLALVGGGIGYVRSRPKSVEVVLPVEKTVVESISASGRLRGQIETSVGAQTGGRVRDVFVREGDRVRAGQPIARLDDSVVASQVTQAQGAVVTAQATLAQAEDSVQTARASLAVARRSALPSDVARVRADVTQNVAVAKARLIGSRQKLAGAKKRLAELTKGPREEEIDAARALLQQARATEEQALRERERQKSLFDDGAVAGQAVDNASTAYLVARRGAENADARLKQLTAGTRPEQLDQARADVRAAEADVTASEATVKGASASGNAQVQTVLASPRFEDVELARTRLREAERARDVARSRISEAQQALDTARQRVGDSQVRAPFEGTVTKIVTEAGGVTGPNAALVQLVRTSEPEIRIDLDESNLGKVQVGQEAIVTCDAFPGESFPARVRELGAQIDTDRGTVEVRLKPEQTPKWLRPGQTLSVNIIVAKGSKRLVVPLLAVNTIGGVSSLYTVEGGKVVKKTVVVGPPGPDGVPVLSGLAPEALVIPNPVGVTVDSVVAPTVVAPSPGPK